MKVRVRYDHKWESWLIEKKDWYNFTWVYVANKVDKENAINYAKGLVNPEIVFEGIVK